MAINLEEIRKYGSLEFLAKQAVEGFITGMHKSPYHGFSVEFAEHKLYNTGESTKHIDWKVYARTDRLYTKRYEEETNLRCQLIIDGSSSMFFPKDSPNRKIDFAVEGAAALAYLLQRQRDAVGLTVFGEDITEHTQCKSTPRHLNQIFQNLTKLQQGQGINSTKVAPILHTIAEKLPRRSLIIIFSDMFDNQESHDEVFNALQHLKHKKHEVVLFHVLDKSKEVEFNFENKPYLFTDLESGEKIKVLPNQVKESYIQGIEKLRKDLKLKCGQYKIDYIDVDINEGLDNILLTYLVKRRKMR